VLNEQEASGWGRKDVIAGFSAAEEVSRGNAAIKT
jgi:hypothetical protein